METRMSTKNHRATHWIDVCKNIKGWSDDEIHDFFVNRQLFDADRTYVFGGTPLLIAQTTCREEADRYEAWNLEMREDRYKIVILNLYE